MINLKNSKKTNRQIVFDMLFKLQKDKGYSNIILNNYFNSNKLEQNDKNFITSLFYGTIEKKITLEYIISSYSKIKINKLDKEVLIALKMAIYELKFMDSKDYAVVDETINIIKGKDKRRAGFVNAILRNFIRDGKNISYKGLNEIKRYSVEYSLTPYMIESIIKDYKKENAIEFFKAQLKKPSLYIRVNIKKTDEDNLIEELLEEGVKTKKTILKNCLETLRGNPINTRAFIEGKFHIQDLSSQVLCSVATNFAKRKVLDVAAAPGGKTFTIAQGKNLKVTSCDIHKFKIDLIDGGAKRLGLFNIETKCKDARIPLDEKFDLVLCDLPCSGFGVIRRKPEIKYKTLDDIKNLEKIQIEILNSAKQSVEEDGILLYSTCTLRYLENEGVKERFLKENQDFDSEPLPNEINELFKNSDRSDLTIMPQYYGSDGFYIAAFRKKR